MIDLIWQDHLGVDINETEFSDLVELALIECRRGGKYGQACVSSGNRLVFAREDYGTITVLDCIMRRKMKLAADPKEG